MYLYFNYLFQCLPHPLQGRSPTQGPLCMNVPLTSYSYVVSLFWIKQWFGLLSSVNVSLDCFIPYVSFALLCLSQGILLIFSSLFYKDCRSFVTFMTRTKASSQELCGFWMSVLNILCTEEDCPLMDRNMPAFLGKRKSSIPSRGRGKQQMRNLQHIWQ